ncbi:glutamate dehydrogenase [Malassezia equina]|uniref:Glutamate dehydrogenase n=1 Tax=Malassezia equina TaxID=1381935 RepID=A0AAF0EEZ6_9BASI|nr:glutamate dehydrogenase [Malassezia equina]
MTVDDLRAVFLPYGALYDVSIPLQESKKETESPKGRGFAFVWFVSKTDAAKAMEAINGVPLRHGAAEQSTLKRAKGKKGREAAKEALEKVQENAQPARPVAVDWSVSQKEWLAQEQDAPSDNEEETTEQDAEQPEENNTSTAEEDNEGDASNEEALDDDDAETPSEPPKLAAPEAGTTLFIRNLPYQATEAELKELFRSFGPLRYARITMDTSTNRSRGTGFVCFWNRESADAVLREAAIVESETTATGLESSLPKSNPFAVPSVITADPSAPLVSKFSLHGRVLNVVRAVTRETATHLEDSARRAREKGDKRNTWLLREGVPFPTSPLAHHLSEPEIERRMKSFSIRRAHLSANPSLHVSKTRLAVHQLPLFVSDKILKRLALFAVRSFHEEVKSGHRRDLSTDEKEDTTLSSNAKKNTDGKKRPPPSIVIQSKVVRHNERIDPLTGRGRSRGYGFLEMRSFQHALKVLRWANGNKEVSELLVQWWREELRSEKKKLDAKGADEAELRSKRISTALDNLEAGSKSEARGVLRIEFSIENITTALRQIIDEENSHQAAVLNDIKLRLREETFTRQSIYEVIKSFPHIVRLLYVHFAHIHYPHLKGSREINPTLSHQRLTRETLLSDEQMHDFIIQSANNSHERQVLLALLTFNKAVLKTNFYTPTKVALSFRLDPSFLPTSEYPHKPFGIFFIVGAEFRGFHVRFRDVARGGIRIIRSRNRENYSINQRTLFDENYGLARTQHLKNKDIPEGGAKGTILPNMDADPRKCFEKYVDSIIDLLIKGTTPGVKEPIVDLVGNEEILFLGPDEGTADFMDWGAEHARERGAPWWKSFTTGKTAATLGGVPHDVFGMTSLSVRQYIFGILRKNNLREEDITKVQTGGPDGDLGSNEILLSKDKTITIIDGSGVIHDPNGLDREELVRLAKLRKMISNFDVSKLSRQGYRVLVEDRNVKLPSGEIISDGVNFRNQAHLLYKADLFVPYASANKGGVTSSSLEVLVGLGLTDEEYISNMLFVNNEPTSFYMNYVHDIQDIIGRNAEGEFEAIWREHEETSKPRSMISTELSTTLNSISQDIENTNLYDQECLRKTVLSHVFPATLVQQVGINELIQRVPASYLKSAFAAQVAASFVYAKGPRASHVDFYNHISSMLEQS